MIAPLWRDENNKPCFALWRSICTAALWSLFIHPGLGQENLATLLDPALQQAIEHRKETLGEAQHYTYSEHYKSLSFDSKGSEKHGFTDTYDIIFLEGAPYKKHVLHDEQPLSPREQQEERKRLADVVKARLEHKPRGLFHASFQVALPLDQLATRFSVTANGSDALNPGILLFSAVPKRADAEGLEQAARDGTAYELKLFVDRQDHVFTRLEAKVLGDGMRYEKDTLITYQFKKVNNEAWLPERFWFKGTVRYLMSDIHTEAEQTYSKYLKFQADTKLITQ